MTNVNEDVSAIVSLHYMKLLSGYKGNFLSALEAVENSWLPDEDDERINVLAAHLDDNNIPSTDRFLLRVGLTAPGRFRGINPPLMVLDKDRGGLSKPRLKEAEGQVARMHDALEVARQIQPDLSTDSQSAIEEIMSQLERSSLKDVDWLELYCNLSSSDAHQLALVAMDYSDSDVEKITELGDYILQNLACFRFDPLDQDISIARAKQKSVWPSSVYRDAGDSVADELQMNLSEMPEGLSLNHLLLAIAWTRSGAAEEAFNSWAKNPPAWESQLYVKSADYLHHGGWSLTSDGTRRDLMSTTCFRLLPDKQDASCEVPCFKRTETLCPSCSSPLCWLFDFADVDFSKLNSPWSTAPKRILTCLQCACYEPVFADHKDGNVTIRKPNNESDCGDEEWLPEPCSRFVGVSAFPPFAAAEAFAIEDASTLGGAPMWLQDAEYPICPDCSLRMRFLAQFDNNSIGEEGIYYACFCDACSVSAVTYQQT